MGHNKMFAAYSEYSIGFRPEAALIQHNSRCGGVAVAVSGEWVGRWRSPTRRQRGQTWPEAISTYLTTKAAPPFLTICLSEEWNGASERQADCAQQSVMPEGRKGFQIWLNVTAFDACIHARLVRHSPGGKERGAEVILLI